jgi:hypothetical protein
VVERHRYPGGRPKLPQSRASGVQDDVLPVTGGCIFVCRVCAATSLPSPHLDGTRRVQRNANPAAFKPNEYQCQAFAMRRSGVRSPSAPLSRTEKNLGFVCRPICLTPAFLRTRSSRAPQAAGPEISSAARHPHRPNRSQLARAGARARASRARRKATLSSDVRSLARRTCWHDCCSSGRTTARADGLRLLPSQEQHGTNCRLERWCAHSMNGLGCLSKCPSTP